MSHPTPKTHDIHQHGRLHQHGSHLGRRAGRRPSAALAVLALVCSGALAAAAPAAADGPGTGAPWAVSLGDSYISGEAGRWAGGSSTGPAPVDALGRSAYLDDGGGRERTRGCHRSTSAEVHIGSGVNGLNLACSGASTGTATGSLGAFKPGLDFADTDAGRGQAAELRSFAADHDVRMVLVAIGGNDFGFSSVVQRCVTDFLTSSSWFPNYCHDDPSVTSAFSDATVDAVTGRIATALGNVRTAMRDAGYTDQQWTLVLQTYPAPLPTSAGIRYPQGGYTRQSVGGCGFWDRDLDWANDTALPTINAAVLASVARSGLSNVAVLDVTHALDGRRLCETGVGRYPEVGPESWRGPGAVDHTEWVNQIRTVTAVLTPYYVQESLHPNYWAQLAIRSCVRQVWNGGAVRGGSCRRTGTGLSDLGEPVMTLQ
jgi:hypothetical protein